MGDHLRVDLGELAHTASALAALCSDFENAGSEVSRASADLGSPALASALEQFATNWDYHKHKLVKLLTAVRDMASEGHATYVAVDAELTSALQSSSPSGSGGGR